MKLSVYKTITILLALIFLTACQPQPTNNASITALPTPVTGQIAPQLTITQIENGVYRITHAYPWPANALLVEMLTGEILLIDTPYTPEATQTVLEWIETSFGKRSITAIVTGYHVDNLGGMQALIDAGIPVYGSQETAKLVITQEEQARDMILSFLNPNSESELYEAHQKIPYLPPTQTFPLAEGLTLSFGSETVQVIYPGPSHTVDNVVVYLPQRKGLFGGCMVLAGDKVGNILDADMDAWPDSIHALLGLEVNWIIPGHGERFDNALLEHTYHLLTQP